MPGTWARSRRAAWGAGHLKVAALLPQALLLALVPSGEEQSALPAGRTYLKQVETDSQRKDLMELDYANRSFRTGVDKGGEKRSRFSPYDGSNSGLDTHSEEFSKSLSSPSLHNPPSGPSYALLHPVYAASPDGGVVEGVEA